MKNRTHKIVVTSLLASLVCVATMIIKVPMPYGYANLGDSIVLVAGWCLSPLYGFFAAAIGSALADVLSGFALYAPVTFVIKGLMAVCGFYIFKWLLGKTGNLPSRIISGLAAEVIMAVGYYIFEGFLYGFGPAMVSLPANAAQGIVGLIVGVLLIKVFEKNKISL